jgi:hypothetical protein
VPNAVGVREIQDRRGRSTTTPSILRSPGSDFQRGIDAAVVKGWIERHHHDVTAHSSGSGSRTLQFCAQLQCGTPSHFDGQYCPISCIRRYHEVTALARVTALYRVPRASHPKKRRRPGMAARLEKRTKGPAAMRRDGRARPDSGAPPYFDAAAFAVLHYHHATPCRVPIVVLEPVFASHTLFDWPCA